MVIYKIIKQENIGSLKYIYLKGYCPHVQLPWSHDFVFPVTLWCSLGWLVREKAKKGGRGRISEGMLILMKFVRGFSGCKMAAMIG